MSLMKSLFSVVCSAAIALPLVACGGDDGGGETVDDTGTDYTFVTSSLELPTTTQNATRLGLNLDNDEQGRPDNALGSILSTLQSQSSDVSIQSAIDEQIADGSIVILANIKATDLSSAAGVGMWLYLGENPSPAPCDDENDMVCGNHLDGSGSFSIASGSPTDALIVGNIVGGQFTTSTAGNVTIEIALVEGGESLSIEMIGAKAEITSISADGAMGGKLGGAVTEDALNGSILPAVVTLLNDSAGTDCMLEGGVCTCASGSTGDTLLDLFDTDDSCDVDLEELKNNNLIASALAPDVDLLDENGDYNPRSDGEKDSLSLGVGFQLVKGSFTVP